MQEVFEKIIEKLSNLGWVFADYYPDGTNISRVSKKSVPFDEVVEIVRQAAAKYEKDNYFNLDEVTLHKCPVCGGVAEHRVKKTGCWACGCFKCKVFKTGHNHDKAIQAWEDFCAEYNNDWIPISSGRLPKECEDVEVTVEEINEVGEKQYYNARSWLQDGRWVIKKNPYNPTVIAWRYPTQPYVPKGE